MFTGREDAAVRQLVWANKILAHEGNIESYGHVSVRNPTRLETFFISSAISPRLVQYEDIHLFSLDCEPLTDMRGRQPYSELPLHGAIYQARPDVQAIIHNHPEPLIVMGSAGLPVRPIVHGAKSFHAGVPVFSSYDVSNGLLIKTMDEARRLARVLGDKWAVLMQNHGAVITGEDLPRAVANSINLVKNAGMQIQVHLLAGVLGTVPQYMSDDAAREAAMRMADPNRAWRFWQSRVPASWFTPGFLKDDEQFGTGGS